MQDPFVLAGREYRSRLIIGTGKYASFAETRRAADAAGVDIVTVAVRRVNITDPGKENLLDHVPPDTDVTQLHPRRCWPIEVFWRCPAPWLEAWVTWRRDDADSGHVTVHLHTPGHHESALLLSPIRNAPSSGYPDYKLQPVHCGGDRGMWVIAHTHQETIAHYEVMNPSPPAEGRWVLPTFGPLYHSYGDIITVQPNEPDGGVLASGRPYTP
jgi:hypothetical protein